MQNFRNLSVWQLARRFTKTVHQLTVDYPPSEEFGLKAQMRRATVSICTNIAEGCGRRGDRDFRRFLDVAMGSACELGCETILSFDLAFITEAIQEEMLAAILEIKKMLGGLISTLTEAITRRSDRSAATTHSGETTASGRRPGSDDVTGSS